jgi:hypothetical protein
MRRLRTPPSRAAEISRLGRKFREEGRGVVSDEERALAAKLKELRVRLASEFGSVSSCRDCARGYPEPAGAFSGGVCCSNATEWVFSEAEIASLALAGTRRRHLRVPRGVQVGCAFRGPRGCTLEVIHRPSVCVRYVCTELSRELYASGRLREVESLSEALEDTFQRFVETRARRLERELWADLHPELASYDEDPDQG